MSTELVVVMENLFLDHQVELQDQIGPFFVIKHFVIACQLY